MTDLEKKERVVRLYAAALAMNKGPALRVLKEGAAAAVEDYEAEKARVAAQKNRKG